MKEKPLLQSLSAGLGCTEQRAGALICSGHSEANTKAAVEALQIFKWDLPAQRALPACPAERSCGGRLGTAGIADKHLTKGIPSPVPWRKEGLQ